MIQMIDHAVILVTDLERAMQSYTDLGFTVIPGGTHADGLTHNALIVFADGTYLELLHFLQAAPQHRWWRHVAHGEGVIDYALLPSDTATAVATAQQHGLALDGPIDGGRLRPDGTELAWQMAIPHTADLPFLCGDVTPRTLRVPEGDLRSHANGVLGIAGITVAVQDVQASAQRYRALLDLPDHSGEPTTQMPPLVVPELGSDIAMFPVGQAAIMLVQPGGLLSFTALVGGAPTNLTVPQRGPVAEFLEARGEGVYGLALWVPQAWDASHDKAIHDTTRTHGVRMQAVLR